MHCPKVIVHSQRLNQQIVGGVLPFDRVTEGFECLIALFATLYSAMLGKPKNHILIRATKLPWNAVIIISTSHDPAMYLLDEITRNRLISRQARNPAICLPRSPRLALRARYQLLRRLFQGRIEFSVRKLGSLDSRGAGYLALELHFLQVFHPTALVWNRREGHHRSLGVGQLSTNCYWIVKDEARGAFVLDDHGVIIAGFISTSRSRR